MSQLIRIPRLAVVAGLMIAALGTLGCGADTGVGDPCDPETVPESGFDETEVYLETNSVQCRTRVCMVYKVDGFPDETNEEDIYCTCRCAADDANTPTCGCPSGYTCTPVLEQGGTGVRGSYCVSNDTLVRNGELPGG